MDFQECDDRGRESHARTNTKTEATGIQGSTRQLR